MCDDPARDRARPLPDFLIIGAQKSGTNTLYDYFAQHPDVRRSSIHEVHFFDNNFDRGVGWYRGHFPHNSGSHRRWLTGETSPYYLFHPLAPRRAARVVPGARLVALLRNPVDRAYSHYHHTRAKGRERLSFEEALEREAERTDDAWNDLASGRVAEAPPVQHHSYLARGRYAEQLARWFACYPTEQVAVVKAEDLYERPEPVMRRLFHFLDLPEYDGLAYRKLNARSYSTLEPRLRVRLGDYFREPVRELADLLGDGLWWEL